MEHEELRSKVRAEILRVTGIWPIEALLDAIMELVGPELDRLRAEVERLTEQVETNNGIASNVMGIMRAERDDLRARLAKVKQALAGHPECDVHPDDDQITCGWKSAVADVTATLASLPEPSDSEPVGKRLDARWLSFPGKNPVCRDCGADWSPVRRGECVACGSDSGPLDSDSEPAPDAGREAGER